MNDQRERKKERNRERKKEKKSYICADIVRERDKRVRKCRYMSSSFEVSERQKKKHTLYLNGNFSYVNMVLHTLFA